MSGSIRRFNTSIWSQTSPFLPGCCLAPPRTGVQRRYIQAAMRSRPTESDVPKSFASEQERRAPRAVYLDDAEPEGFGSRDRAPRSDSRKPSSSTFGQPHRRNYGSENRPPSRWKDPETSSQPVTRDPNPIFAEHLNGLFPELVFPKELARRILTHASHPAAVYGHNNGLSFIGRRVLESYLLLLLSSSPNLKPTDDLEIIISRTLSTYVLGEHVGPIWGLGRVMRWSPAVKHERLQTGVDQTALLKSVGLYKVQGEAVAAVIGGIFHQFGASVAHRVFHTRVLPHILLGKKEDGLPEAFHSDARTACNQMGGMQGPLLVSHTPNTAKQVPKPPPQPKQPSESDAEAGARVSKVEEGGDGQTRLTT